MTATQLSPLESKIEKEDFENTTVTASSDKYLALPHAVKFASKHGCILQSACEAGAFCINADGSNNADIYQATRTGVVYFKSEGKFYAAIDDIYHPEQNIVIARAEEGFASHLSADKFLVPIQDLLVRGVINRAEDKKRVVEVDEKRILRLSTQSVDGKSEFGQNAWVKAVLFGISEPYAQMRKKQYDYDDDTHLGYVCHLTPEILEKMGVNEHYAEVRWWRIGGDGFDDRTDICSDQPFDAYGLARAVFKTSKVLHKSQPVVPVREPALVQ